MRQSFSHLHVASANSPHYGVTMPEALVEQAAVADADFLALTDRDGLYGAVKHIRACAAAGIRAGTKGHRREHRLLKAVIPDRGTAAACSKVKLTGFRARSEAGAATYSAKVPELSSP